MLFNSFIFALFFPVVFATYWSIKSLRVQNGFVLIASYLFYGWWDWRFLGLIALSSIVDYSSALGIENAPNPSVKKRWVSFSIAANLSVLCAFKYFNFFVGAFAEGFAVLGLHFDVHLMSIVLPVGISFYTFQTMSYTIDVYRGVIRAERNLIAVFAFVSFFPQLVAGPIERAKNLLPQFSAPREFSIHDARDGLRQILWGLFKKIVIADRLAQHVDHIFSNYSSMDGSSTLLGMFFFGIQIYCDFSGYSDIAIGVAKLLGFRLMDNFRYPYFSRNIAEFWQRWHISLSTWFRDYVYIPMGGSRVRNRAVHFRNIVVTFCLSGLWHGANWTFLTWGLIHGLCYLPTMISSRSKRFLGEPTIRDLPAIALTFLFVNISWCFFRASSVTDALRMLQHIFVARWALPVRYAPYLAALGLFLCVEWLQRRKQHPLCIDIFPMWVRWALYYGLIVMMVFYGKISELQFIYFQF